MNNLPVFAVIGGKGFHIWHGAKNAHHQI